MLKGLSKSKSCLMLAGALFTSHSYAGGVALYEIGSDDVGLAAAGYSARAQDPSTILTNPAGMTRLEGKQVFIGVQLLYDDLKFSADTASPFLGTDNGGNPADVIPGGSVFFHYSISDDLKVGLGLYGNFGSILKYHGDWIGRYTTVKTTLLGTSLQPSLAYRVTDGLSVGAGPVFMYGILRSKTRIDNSPFGIFDFHDGEVKLSDKKWGVGANVGLLYEFNSCTRVGIDYTSPIKLNFSPDAVFTDLAAPLNTVLATRGLLNTEVDIGITVPQTAMLSIFHQWDPVWAVLVSAGWQNWKKFGQVDIEISSLTPVSLTVDKQYTDTWHGAVGIQHQLNERVKFNAGVGYDNRFQPTANIPPSTPVNSAWRFGLGSHFDVNKVADAGVAVEYIYGGTLHTNHHGGIVTGDFAGEYKHARVFFLAANINLKCP